MKGILLLLLFSLTVCSCSTDDVDDLLTDEEEVVSENNLLIGEWNAVSAIIDGEIKSNDSCELSSTLEIRSDLFIDRFFSDSGVGCRPIFVNGPWILDDDVLSLIYNDGRGVYLAWQILEVTDNRLRISLVDGINEQTWEYSR